MCARTPASRGQAAAGPAAGADRRPSTCVWSQRAAAAGRPRQPGGGRRSPRAGRVLGPARAGCRGRHRLAGGSPRLRRSPASGLGHRGRGTATLARGPAGPGPPDAAGIVDRRGPAALRPAEGLRRPGADDLDGRRDALGPLAGPPADPPRTAQPATGARVAASPQRRSGGLPACGSPIGSGGNWPTCWTAATADGRNALARQPSSQDSTATLDDVGLLPQNLPERISRSKLVEELLDRVVERGFLTLGEVRDAISRNQLKEPDCTGPGSFLRGDAALRMDGRLADTLDGVYEPADFYLRWILRFSHLMFGTATGRFITLYFVIPFGGAYVALKGSDHLVELFSAQDAPGPQQQGLRQARAPGSLGGLSRFAPRSCWASSWPC